MTQYIEFFFEFSSPYSYIASKRIESLAAKHDRSVIWKPFLLGAVFKNEGTRSLASYPTKGPYSKRDIERTAAFYGVPYKWPPTFPVVSLNAARAVLWAQQEAPNRALSLIHALYDKIFGLGEDISHIGSVAAAAQSLGLDGERVAAQVKDPAVKEMLKGATDEALARNVFGAPFLFIDGEPFWGNDRLDMADAWMNRGGW